MSATRSLSTAFRLPLAFMAIALLAAAPAAAQNPAPAAAPAQQLNAPTFRFGGVVYSGYEYWMSDSLGHTNQFDLQRAYMNAIATFGPGVTTRITVDVFRPSTTPSLAYRIKYAYFQWLPSLTGPVGFRFGVTQTPWLDWEETLYGFRMQGSMPMERAGFITSSDIGAAMDFATKDKGLLNGTVGVYNGEGYANPPGGKFLDYEARASLRLLKSNDASPQGGLRLTGYGHLGRVDALGGPLRNRAIGELSYKSKLFTLAGEAGMGKTGSAGTATVHPPEISGSVLAAFGVLNVPQSNWQVLARLDHFTPNTDVSDSTSTRFIAGVAYRISPNVRVLGDIDAVSYNQTAPLAAAVQAQKSKFLFQTEFTF